MDQRNTIGEEVKGRARGGKATAAKMTPEERSARARKGSIARWGDRKKEDPPKVKRGLSEGMAAALNKSREGEKVAPRFAPPLLPNGVVPGGQKSAIAMDYAPGVYDFANLAWGTSSDFAPFPGYPYLAGLATRAEYRAFADALSSELTREWIKFKGASNVAGDGQSEQDSLRIPQLEAAIKKHNLQDIFKLAAAQDCFFGRAQISVNIKSANNQLPLVLSPKTVKQGSLEGFTCVEAMWTTPSAYNAIDPTAPDFYRPREWFMLGNQVHASRLLTIVTRPLPDMLKPAYNFSGMSLSQLAEPYVNNWLRTRQSVADLINNFSITALKTNMVQVLQGGSDGADIFARADLFTATRANRGVMLLDKDTEELAQVNTPLSGLHELQSQAQEHMCSVSRMPAIILTGISPGGLNASSDSEIRVFYDWIASQQNAFWRHPLEVCIKLIMLDLWGEIDETITFEFNPLWQVSAKEEAEIRTANANAAVAYITNGVLAPEEVREYLAADPTSGFSGIDISQVPEPDEPEIPGELGQLQTQDKSISESQHKAMADAPPGHGAIGIHKYAGRGLLAKDAEWEEGDHPRAENGQFGSGGSGGLSKEAAKKLKEYQKAEKTLALKIKSGEPLNSREKYLIENQKDLEKSFGVSFAIPESSSSIAEKQKEEQDEAKRKEGEVREQKAKEQREEAAKLRAERDKKVTKLHNEFDSSIEAGDTNKSASYAMKIAESNGYMTDVQPSDVNDNSSPVPYRVGAAMAVLNKNGWSTDVGASSIKGDDSSFYITAKKNGAEAKIRVANHGNTTSLHEKPTANISPGEDVIDGLPAILEAAEKSKNALLGW